MLATIIDNQISPAAAAEIARLRKLVEEAYCEGFQEGKDGGWIGGPSASWKGSDARAALKKRM